MCLGFDVGFGLGFAMFLLLVAVVCGVFGLLGVIVAGVYLFWAGGGWCCDSWTLDCVHGSVFDVSVLFWLLGVGLVEGFDVYGLLW